MSPLSDRDTRLTYLLQPCPVSLVWVGQGRFGNGSDTKARPRMCSSINALLTLLLKQSCFVNHLHGLALGYELHKEAFGIINCICTA